MARVQEERKSEKTNSVNYLTRLQKCSRFFYYQKEIQHMTKPITERIENLKTQITQLENQRKQLLQKQKADERKARTKRLIERGAILESLIKNAEGMTNEQVKELLQNLLNQQ
jgi:hypothetical protein